MNYHLTFIFSANETTNEKLLKKAKSNPNLRKELVLTLVSILNLTFELDSKDEIKAATLMIGQKEDPLDD